MRKLVVCWILIGCVGYFILPWYVVDDGFFSIEFFQYYSLEDYGPAIILFFLDDKIWLLPLLFFLLVPVVFFFKKTNNSIYSNLFIFIGLLGLIYFFFQGFSIGLRGWNYNYLENVFGPVDRQYGMGVGAVLVGSTFVFYITHGLASRGWLNGDNFIVGSIGSIIFLVSLFVFYPIFRMFSFAFKSVEGGYELGNFFNKFLNKGVWGLECLSGNYSCGVIWNTLTMGTLSAFSSTFLGLAFALLIVRTNFRGKKIIRVLSVLPIITPPFVKGLAIILLFGQSGAISSFLEWAFEIERSRWIYGLPGIWFSQTLAFTPIAFLVLIGVVESVSPSMEEASQTLRASSWQVFKTVSLPLMRPGIANAFLLGFIESLADLGNPLVLGGDFDVLSTEIFFAVVGAQYDESRAAVFAVMLLTIILIVFFLQYQWLGKKSYISVTGKGDSGVHPVLPPMARTLIYAFALPWAAITFIIYIMILFGGFVELWGLNHSFTLKHYIEAFGIEFLENNEIMWSGSAWNSFNVTFLVAFFAAPPTTAIGILTAYLLTRHKFRGKNAFEFGTMLSFAIPGTIIGVSYVFAFNIPPIEMTGTGLILVISFIFRNMPVGVRAGIASMNQLDPHLDEASMTLNASSFQTFKNIPLPLLKPAIIAAFIFSFVRSVTAISAVIFLVSANYDLAVSYILGRLENNDYGLAIVYSSVLIISMLMVIILIQRLIGKTQIGRRDPNASMLQANLG